MPEPTDPHILSTTAGEIPLHEYHLELDGRVWRILHTGALLTREEELCFLDERRLPFGVVLWPAAIALAHEVASRRFAGARVLEIGAGTGLPGIIAASLGAHVVETDRHRLVLHVCKLNAARNGVTTIEHREADWTAWDDAARYDCILGSDVLYGDGHHPYLRRIFEENLAPGGLILLADPFRTTSLALLEAMEADGWHVSMNKWIVGVAAEVRPVGVFELTRPLPSDRA